MKTFKLIVLVITSFVLITTSQAKVVITEVMPCNISTYMDKGVYNFPGWMELYNDGDELSLKGYTISHYKIKDDQQVLKWEWTITEDIKVGSEAYRLLFFDEEDASKHAPYKLDSDGGIIILSQGKNKIDSLKYSRMDTHISYGRYGDGAGYMNPTPKAENSAAYTLDKRVKSLSFENLTPGLVESGKHKVTIKSPTTGATIYYTTNGSEPTLESDVYKTEIEIDTTTVIRARAFLDDYPASEILTGTFLYMDYRHKECGGYTVPIVSVSTDKDYMEDPEVGMLVVGENGLPTEQKCLTDVGITKANFLQDWKRPVVFEYIKDGKSVMTHEMEAAVIGGCSRKNEVQSLKFKAGKKVGSTKEYLEVNPFEDRPGNKYSSLHLRNGGNAYEASQVRIRDGYMQSLSKVMNIDYQAFQPVAYYLNGKYKGLMGLRERTNKDYVEANYGLDEEDMEHMELVNESGVEAKVGTLDWYKALVSFLENNSPGAANYFETACKYMDMDEYIDFQLFEHFIVNTDWPGNNAKIWRDKKNGKLRWIIYDTDFGLGLYTAGWPNYCDVNLNSIEWAAGLGDKVNWANGTEYEGPKYTFDEHSKWKVTIFAHLLQNPQFQEKFINKTLIHLATTFSNERVQDVWDSLVQVVDNEYCAFTNGTSLKKIGEAESMVKFALQRPEKMYDYTADYFDLGDYVNLEYSSDVDGVKYIMNGDFVNSSVYKGRYISGNPIKLEAVAPQGYKFKYWEMKDSLSYVELMGNKTPWKYFYQSESPESAWKTVGFDDSDWMDGVGKMGYSIETEESKSNLGYNTILDFGENSKKKYMRAYFRNVFTVQDKSEFKEFIAKIVYDDGYIFYLNGKEISRQKVANDLKEGEEYAHPDSEDAVEEVTISMDDIVEGENVFAIMVCQNSSESSDFTFKFSLKAEKAGGASTIKDERSVYSSVVSGNMTLKAVFEKEDFCSNYPDALVFNEVAPSNDSTTDIIDEYGIHSDWFEIYNAGEDTINLAGFYLSDDANNLGKSMIPFTHPDSTKIAPKGYLRFWADNAVYRGPLHVDFKLSNTNPTGLYLSAKCEGKITSITQFSYSKLPQNASSGRYLDKDDFIFDNSIESVHDATTYLFCPTPGKPNVLCELSSVGEEEEVGNEDNIIEQSEVQIYPNPTDAILNIQSNGVELLSVSVYDNMGRLLLTKSVNQEKSELDVSQLSLGTYYLQVVTTKEVLQYKVLKK